MKIALIGYGKMGHEIEKIAISRGHQVVCAIDKDNHHDFDSEGFKSADVVIEFTSPTTAYDNVINAFERGKKVVCGSTGWMVTHADEMKKLCKEEHKTLFWSSNFSLGVYIFSAVNKYLARIMNNFSAYDVSMTETHHVHKLDAPSGTAITLAEAIIKELARKDKWVKGTLQSADGSISGSAQCAINEFPINSIRKGEVPGIHSIRYDSEADSITITHDAKNRKGFAMGAVLAAEFTVSHDGFIGMDDLFQF
ncbi:MAG: 4-hydroxy-tetrahydrodipicolinate reductase [Phocaeicola sp.]|uniref:4-hydroxy-tetrahydrodipicolinate reductase n=1 Tax=Phocaeicola TaxID=909656 RepID=UPI00234E8C9B|nr:4-hydroxy-tetrahydrodipicolinate reductase [Phocaeicola oris]MCE2616127.1 4-hydroxy-tetrahydrodipicolinate reductase [Phocaeicola oris]